MFTPPKILGGCLGSSTIPAASAGCLSALLFLAAPLSPASLSLGEAQAAGLGAGGELAPYRAVYELSLDRSRPSTSVAAVEGIITFSWEQTCGGSVTEHRSVMTIQSSRGANEVAWRVQAWETDDGGEYRATIQHFRNGIEVEHLRAQARFGVEGAGENGGGVARITAIDDEDDASGEQIALPAGTIFPTQYTRGLIAGLRNAQVAQFHRVFDGSGEARGLYEASAFMIEALPEGRAQEIDSPLLEGQLSWRLQLAYFEEGGEGGTPVHEQTFRLYENGVVTDLGLDYGAFALNAELTELQALEPPECSEN